MAIQIITDFDSKSKICYVSDDVHGECYVEGRASDNIRGLATLAAALITDCAESIVSDEKMLESFQKSHELIPDSVLPIFEKVAIAEAEFVAEQIHKAVSIALARRKMQQDGCPKALSELLSELLVHNEWNREESEDK